MLTLKTTLFYFPHINLLLIVFLLGFRYTISLKKGCPMNTITNFSDYKLSKEVAKALDLLQFNSPTKVQQDLLPLLLEDSKQNYIVKAKTGSGKTAAYGIPLIEHIEWLPNSPQSLILVPTRELSHQVAEELSNFSRLKRLKVSALYGKSPMNRQKLELKQKTHIVVGTPGRIRDLIQQGYLKVDLIQYLVLDEADELFHEGLCNQIEDIIRTLPPVRQNLLFSATIDENLLQKTKFFLDSVVQMDCDTTELSPTTIQQLAFCVEDSEKRNVLTDLFKYYAPESCILFSNTQENVDSLSAWLQKSGYSVKCLHGGMMQKERNQIMSQFKLGAFRYLVATDVAARGIDIEDISLVLNYDFPRGQDNYVHRIGRSGRKGKEGLAITLFNHRQEHAMTKLNEFMEHSIEILPLSTLTISTEQLETFQKQMLQAPKSKEKKNVALNKSILKLHINAGKKQKIRTNEIVATICSIPDITPEDIGIIEIQELATHVEILNNKGKLVLKEIQTKTIKGKTRKVSIARR